MSFTVLRVEVQHWKDEGLPVSGQSEEGVEAHDVVEEEGHQEDCGHRGMRVVEPTMFSVFIIRAKRQRILPTLFIDPLQSFTIIPVIVFTARLFCFVEFDRQVDIRVYVGSREDNIEGQDG